MALLTVLAVAGCPAAAPGADGPFLGGRSGAKSQPERFVIYQAPALYRFTSLNWRRWGKQTARAKGKLTVCITAGGGCERIGRVQLKVRELDDGTCDGTSGRFYMRGVVRGGNGTQELLLDPSFTCG